jgi:CRP/FNR family cyclic AMP-dependent transcriptional regulator
LGEALSTALEDTLAAVDIFAGLSRRQIKKLVGAGREVRRDSGKAIATEGLGALAFHVILEGTAEVTRAGNSLRELGPGEYFGEISMIDGKPRSATVSATSELTTFVIPHAEFAELVNKDAELASALLVSLCGRLREAEARG